MAVGAALLGTALWTRQTFGVISVDQMLLNLPGAGGGEPTAAADGYILSYLVQALILPLGVVLLAWIGWTLLRRAHQAARQRQLNAAHAVPATSPVRAGRALWYTPTVVALCVLVTGGTLTWQTFGLTSYLKSVLSPYDMGDYYVMPTVELDGVALAASEHTRSDPLNLVLIYLESAETMFRDASKFEENLYAPLDRVTVGWESIDALRTYPGGGWTMAGSVGTQCGIPLRGPGLGANDVGSNEIGAAQDAYLPGAFCLGDALEAAGYTNTFLGGADATFASKRDFLNAHGYQRVRDYHYWMRHGEEETSGWGLSDRALLDQAKAEISRLHGSGEPFNLTLLTLDFHEPLHVFDYCDVTTDEPLGSVLRCSNEQVAELIEFMAERGYLDDTAVVIMGDHPKMVAEGGAYSSEFTGVEKNDRTLYNRIWAPEGPALARTDLDQLDMYATILDLVGLGSGDGRAGLGTSGFVSVPEGSPRAELTADQYRELLGSRSTGFYRALWGLEELERLGA